MKAQCCICSDLFENCSDASAAAAPCGHTFHEMCLLRWMESSSTCPTCRVKITQKKGIRRLYFDIREHQEGEPDAAEISNQNGILQAQISQLTRDKNNLARERDELAISFAKCESEKETSTQKLKDVNVQNKMLFKDLAAKEKTIVAFQNELVGYAEAKQKLATLESINTLITDSGQECSEYSSCFSGGGEDSIQQLCQVLAVIKREYSKAISKKNLYREQVRTLKADNLRLKGDFKKASEELGVSRQRLEKAEQEVFSLETENNKRRRNIAHLRLAIRHNKTEGSDSFLKALSEDSPNVAYSPPHSKHTERLTLTNSPVLHNVSGDLFEDYSKLDTPPQETVERTGDKMSDSPVLEIPLIATTSLLKSKPANEKKKNREQDEPPVCPFAKYSIMQKKLTGVSSSHRFFLPQSRVYNGLGGSKKLDRDEPLGPSKQALLKFAPKKPSKRKLPVLQGQSPDIVPVDCFFKENLPAKPSTKNQISSTATATFTCASTSASTNSRLPIPGQEVKKKREAIGMKKDLIEKLVNSHRPLLSRPNSADAVLGSDVIDLTDI